MYIAAQEAAKELDIEIDVSHGLGQVGVDPTFRSYAERGYKIIFGHTIGYQDSALRVAPDYKNTYFIVPDAWMLDNLPNMISIPTPIIEGAYLAGLAAAGVTKTGVVGAMDGEKYPRMLAVTEAFKAGAERGAQILGKQIKVIRDFVGVWDDVTAGREKALALIDAGADVLLFRGDGITLGGIQACSLRGVWAIGDMTDQNALAPKTILTSNITNWKVVIEKIVDLYRKGQLKGGFIEFGLADGANDIAPFYEDENLVPKVIRDEINKVRADVKAGTFKIPIILEERAW